MSEQYTISAVSERTRDYGDKRVYYVRLNEAQAETPSQAFELHQKQASKAPQAGQTIDVKVFDKGTFEGEPYVKIIKDWDAIKARGGGGGSSSQGSDERGESIERQVAAKTAGLMAMSTPASSGVVMQANFEEFFETVLRKIQGSAPVQQTLNGGGGEVPADTTGMVPAATAATATDGDDIPFRRLPVPDFEARRRDLFTGDRAF